MSMPLGFSVKASLFSMRRRLIRTILALIPCVILIAIMFVGSTIPNGLVKELDNQVLKTIESHQEIVILDKFLFSQSNFSAGPTSGAPSNNFNQKNYDVATKSPLIEKVYPQYGEVSGTADAVGNISQAGLSFKGSTPEFVKLYTPQTFTYQPGQPIPVLLNPTTIGAQAYNWGGKDTIEIDYANPSDQQKKMNFVQLKDPENIVGKTFKMEFGKLDSFPEAFDQQTQGGFGPPKSKLIKLADNDRDILTRRVSELYSPYWDVSQLRQPIVHEFIILLFGHSKYFLK